MLLRPAAESACAASTEWSARWRRRDGRDVGGMGARSPIVDPTATATRTIGGAALGCRRLAIIDVAGGAQPLANETGDVVVVCNGEIYNHARLRDASSRAGTASAPAATPR